MTRADDPENHVLWILGTPPPLPKRMKWKSTEIEQVIRGSQEVLLASSISFEPDEKIGFFKGLSLLPAALGARKNPDKGELKDLLPPELYARWLVQKKKYLGRNQGIEKWRPIFAAYELREEAFDDNDLREGGVVTDIVAKIVKQTKIKTTTPSLQFTFKTREIKNKIREFSRSPLSDIECFATTLQLVDAIGDEDSMHHRATAWATGDLQTLVELPPLPDPNVACATAIMGSQLAQEFIPGDIRSELKELWIDAAEKSLTQNASTFALLSIGELTGAEGRLAVLRARGYSVVEPMRD